MIFFTRFSFFCDILFITGNNKSSLLRFNHFFFFLFLVFDAQIHIFEEPYSEKTNKQTNNNKYFTAKKRITAKTTYNNTAILPN